MLFLKMTTLRVYNRLRYDAFTEKKLEVNYFRLYTEFVGFFFDNNKTASIKYVNYKQKSRFINTLYTINLEYYKIK